MPPKINSSDISSFSIQLYKVGPADCLASIRAHCPGNELLVFSDEVTNNRERYFSFYGLESSCSYRVSVLINFNKAANLTRDYHQMLGVRQVPGTKVEVTESNFLSDLYPVQSMPLIFATPSDEDKVLCRRE